MRKYSLNESFFDDINTEEKAYFLGFLFADGYNDTNRGVINLSLKENDVELLEKLKNLVQPEKPLQYVKQIKSANQYRLAISSRHISNRLAELGCTNRKTFTLTFPDLEKDLIPHFIRGFFDGNGGVSSYVSGGYQKFNFNIVSTEEFIESLQNILISELKFNKVKTMIRFPERNNNIRTLSYSGRGRCKTFKDWIYKDATIFLERKKEIFNEVEFVSLYSNVHE